MKIKIIAYSLFVFLNVGNCLAQTLFTENMGSPSASPTSIAANVFKNSSTLTYSNGAQATAADIRTTSVSNGYTGASGGGNVWFTSTSGAYGFSIEGINASSYSSLFLEFGYRKESASAHATFSVDYWNGSSWITIANTSTTLFNQTASAASAWYLSKTLILPSAALINGLKIRFVKTGSIAIRIDDVKLKGPLTDTTFNQVAPICSGASLSPLPTTSTNGITGTWSPALNNTATTTYTFTPNAGQSGTIVTQTIVVNPLPTATISGSTSTCINFPTPIITFTGLNGTSNYKFTYKINNGTPLTVTSSIGSSTATVSVPTSTARTDIYTLLNVEDVSTTCSQSQTGSATITVDVCTALTSSLRGITLGDLNSVLSVSAVTGATTYRYEVTNLSTNVVSIFERTDSNKTLISLDQLQAAPASPTQTITYGTTYSIRVAVDNGSYVFGPAYTVTTPLNVPTTKLANKYCGARITALNEAVYANILYNANRYKFKVNGGGIVDEEIISNSYALVLTSLTQAPILYNTEYTIQVKVSVDGGVTYPTDYGTTCSVFTPVTVPLTRIVSPDCGTTLSALNTVLYATSIFGVNLYKYEVSGGTLGTRVYTTPNASLRLTNLEGGAEYSTSYTIRVAVSLDNGTTWEPYGVSCSITTPAVVPSVPIISSISSNSIDITLGNDLNSSATTYAILETSTSKYVQSNGTLGVTAVYQNRATWGIKTVVNLSPLTMYSFKVTAQNSLGTTTLAGPTASGTTLVAKTKVMQSICGSTLTSVNSTIYADAITEATMYRFEVTNGTTIREYETTNRYFTLSQLSSGGAYNTTYSIRVAIFYGIWQPYGVTCNVTTPTISPTMMACGSSLSNLYSTISAFDAPLATMYRFKIKKQGTTETTILESSIRTFNLSQLTASDPTGIATYSTTYSVSVAVKIEDVWSNDSPPCNYITPSPGTTMMGCGSTLANLYSTIASFDAPLATIYRFTIKNTTTNGISILETPTRDFNLSQLTTSIGSAGIATYKTTYAIAVAVKIADVWTNDSPFCNFSTPVGTTIMPASCGITLTSLNTLIYANAAPLASGYRFEVTNGSIVRTYDSTASERSFSLDKLQGGGAYNTTYAVRVAVLIDGIPTDYSPSCNIISPTNCSGTLDSPISISGNISPYTSTSNLVYSIPLVNFASKYTWTVPTGWVISSGVGTNSIVVTSGAINQNGTISVIAEDGCRISNVQNLAVSVISPSNSSDIVIDNSSIEFMNNNIDYSLFQGTTLANTGTGANGSIGVMGLYLRDGAESLNDTDDLNTELIAISFTATNASNIRSARLFNGSTPLGNAVAVNGISPIVFTGLTGVIASDNSQLALNLRVTFNSIVIDNQQMQFTVNSVTAKSGGSSFASSNGGAASTLTTGDINRIEVTANRLAFSTQPPTTILKDLSMNPAPSVEAIDSNNNRDLDFTGSISITSSGSLNNSPITVTANSGIAVFNSITHNTIGSGLILTTNTQSLTSSSSSPFSVTLFTELDGDYRALFDGTTFASGGSSPYNWQIRSGGIWVNTSISPQTAKPSRILIDKKFIYGAGTTTNKYNDIIVLNGGSLFFDDNDAPPVMSEIINSNKRIEVQSGGELHIEGDIDLPTTGNLIVRSGGTLYLDQASITYNHPIWDGTELFEAGSTVVIKDWGSAGSVSGSLINGASMPTISANQNGYIFGNLIIDIGATRFTNSWILVGGAFGIIKLCENNFDISNESSYFIYGASNKTGISGFDIKGDMTIYDGAFSFGSNFSNDPFNHQFIINGNFECASNDALKIHHLGNALTNNLSGNVTFKGDVIIANTVTSFLNEGGSTAGNTRMSVNFEGGTIVNPKFIDIYPTAIAMNMNLKNNGYRKLRTQDLTLNSVSGYTAIFTLETGSSLDFSWANPTTGTTPLAIKRSTSSPLGTNSFTSQQGSTLVITAPDGINLAAGNTGITGQDLNLKMSSPNIINPLSTFWYKGKTNQHSGTAIGTSSNGRQVIIELNTNATSLTFDTSFGITNDTSISPTGGILDIRKGKVLETTNAYISSSTGGLSMAAGTLYQIQRLSADTSDAIPRLNGISNSYSLSTSSTIELNGAGNQTLRGGRDYSNLIFSNSGTKTISSNLPTNSLEANVTIQDSAILDLANNEFSGTSGLNMSGTSRLRMSALNTILPQLTGVSNPYSLTGGTIELYGTTIGQTQFIRGSYGLTNTPISYNNIDLNSISANIGVGSANVVAETDFNISGIMNVYNPTCFKVESGITIGDAGTSTFEIKPGATFKYGDTISTSENIGAIQTDNRIFSPLASYGFVGSAVQTTAGLPSSIVNLYIDKNDSTKIVTLTDLKVITGSLTFYNGKLDLSTFDLTLDSEAQINDASSNNYIVTSSSGKLIRNISGSGTFHYPIGSISSYNPASFTWDTSPGINSLSLLYTSSSITSNQGLPVRSGCLSASSILNNGFWIVNSSGTATTKPSITFTRNGHDNAGMSKNNHAIIRRNNSNAPWESAGNYINSGNFAINPTNTGQVDVTQTDLMTTNNFAGEYALAKGTDTAPTSAIISGSTTICEGSNTDLRVDIIGNSTSYTIVYSDGTNNFTEIEYISGTPISVSPLNTKTFYLVSVFGDNGCLGSGNSGMAQIIVNPNNLNYELTSEITTNQQSIYVNNAIKNISYSTTDVTSVTFEGLPDGVIGNFTSNSITISGTPTVAGNFKYSITLTGNCGSIVTIGTINVHSPENVNYCVGKSIQFSFDTIDINLSYTWSSINSDGIVVNTVTNATGLYTFTSSVPDNYTIKLVAEGTNKCETVFSKNITVTYCEPVVDCEMHFNFNFKLPLPGSYFGGTVLNTIDRVNIVNGVIDFANSKFGTELLLTTYDDAETSGARTTFVQSKVLKIYDPIITNDRSEFGTNRFLRVQNNNYDDTFNKIINQPVKGIINNPSFSETNPLFKKMDISFFIMSEDQFTNPQSIQNSYNQLINSGKTNKVFFIFVEEGKFKDLSSGAVNNPIQFMFWLKAEEMRLYDRDNPESKILDSDFVLFSKQEIADLGFRTVLNNFLQKAYSEIGTSRTDCQAPISCATTNPNSPKIKKQLVNLVNKLLHQPKGKVVNGYACQELAIFSPFVNTFNSEKPAIYNFVHDTIKGYVAFSFRNHPDYDVKIKTNESSITGGSTIVADFNLDKYQSKESITLVRSSSNDTFESYVRNIDFCSDAIYCQSHIALVVDESGSIDANEANKIKKQLKLFIAKQAKDNDDLQSNIYISLTGLSDSDINNRNDNIPTNNNTPIRVSLTDDSLTSFNTWIDNYGSRYGNPIPNGISAGSDYWKSGLDKALSYDIKPNIVLLITDGCQTADILGLQQTLARFDNSKITSNTETDKPHLYVVGIENGFYVNNETTLLPHDQDPNYNPDLLITSSNATNSPPFLQKSLKFLLGYTNPEFATQFPVSSINDFAKADYYGHDNFNLLASDETYFSDKLSISSYVCGEPATKDFCDDCFSFQPELGEEYLLSAWVKEESNIQVKDYVNPVINVLFYNVKLEDVTTDTPKISSELLNASGDIIDGWQRIVKNFKVPAGTMTISIELENKSPSIPVYFDDIRIHPLKGSMKTFVYDPETFKLMSELDENNYSTFYEYDNEGGLVRVKKETAKGVKTIQETRSGSVIKTN